MRTSVAVWVGVLLVLLPAARLHGGRLKTKFGDVTIKEVIRAGRRHHVLMLLSHGVRGHIEQRRVDGDLRLSLTLTLALGLLNLGLSILVIRRRKDRRLIKGNRRLGVILSFIGKSDGRTSLTGWRVVQQGLTIITNSSSLTSACNLADVKGDSRIC